MNSILRHLEAIIETGSVLGASRKLFLSAPALSQYVKRIEAEYGIEIFNRTTSPWTLTEEGAMLLETQRRMELLDRQCRQYFDDRKGLQSGEVRIGSIAIWTATALNPVLAAFRRAFPKITICVEEGTTRSFAAMLESGQIDCAFAVTSLLPASIESTCVKRERVLLAVPPGHPYAAAAAGCPPGVYPPADLTQLGDASFISMRSGQYFRDLFERLCEKRGVSFPVTVETHLILTVPALVGAGVGCALVPDTLEAECRRFGVALFSLGGDQPESRIGLAWKKGGYQSYAARAFIESALRTLGVKTAY